MHKQLSFAGFDAAPQPAHNVFFAIYPDVTAAAGIAGLTQHLRGEHGLKGKLLAADRFHISLCNIGAYASFPHAVVAAACAVASAMALPPFDVEFDRAVSFRGKPGNLPLVLLCRDRGAPLVRFQLDLGSALTRAGISHGVRSQFTPHVTLMYAERGFDEQAIGPVRWSVREFVLVDSLRGPTRHVPLGRWPLAS